MAKRKPGKGGGRSATAAAGRDEGGRAAGEDIQAKKRRRAGADGDGEATHHHGEPQRPGQQSVGGGELETETLPREEIANDEVVEHISAFLSWKSPRANAPEETMEGDDGSSSKRREEPLDSISYLAGFLEAESSSSDGEVTSKEVASEVAITEEDVATLLLPWAVARLMRWAASSATGNDGGVGEMGEADALAWRALAGSLKALSPKEIGGGDGPTSEGAGGANRGNSPHEGLLSGSLSQGALNRLVPCAARVSFAAPIHESDNEVPVHAAKCFVYLARRHRPPFDGACHGLLREVDELVSTSSASNELTVPQQNVVCATLSMLHSLMSGANAKKLFATLSSMEVLPRLGRLAKASGESEGLVQGIVEEGLFHRVHHMEGFRTLGELQTMPPLPKLSLGDAKEEDAVGGKTKESAPEEAAKGKGKKTSFQSNLFSSVQRLFALEAPSGDDGEGSAESMHDAAAAANLLPVLTRTFFERIRDGAKQRPGGGEAEARLQFRFWCRLVLPALELLFRGSGGGSSSVAVLHAVAETLKLVLEFDAYLPSYTDPDGEHLAFLEFATQGLLRCVEGDGVDGADEKEMALVASLHRILMLNHRLLHERLASVVSFACSCLSSSGGGQFQLKKRTQANALLSDIVNIYRELRQVGHFLSSARDAFSAVNAFTTNLLDCGNVVESLSMAYQSCPSGQLHEIWSFFDAWIVDIARQEFEHSSEPPERSCTDAAAAELSFAVQMFIIFIRNVRANKHNSPELRAMCEKSAKESVAKLLGKACGEADIVEDSKGHRGILMRHGFDLCGWLVDLHTRSCFWIDDANADMQQSSLLFREGDGSDDLNVLAYLREVAEATVSSKRFGAWKDSWLQQYWESGKLEGNGLGEFSDIGIPLPLRGSLQRLALHRVHQLHAMIYYSNLRENERHAVDLQDDHSSSQLLTNEAKALVEFALYVACSQLTRQSASQANESLWVPVTQSLCIWTHYCEPFHAELFLIWLFSTLCQDHCKALPPSISRIEKTAALTLVRDASFFDVSQVMSLFAKVGIHYAFTQFLTSIDAAGTISLEPGGVTASCTESAERTDANLSLCSNVSAVAEALAIVASMPLELPLCNENLNLLDRIVGLDVLASRVAVRELDAHERIDPHLLNTISSTKSIVVNILPKILLGSSDCYAPCLANVPTLLSRNIPGFRGEEGVLSASCGAISEHFSLCVDYHEKEPRLLESFFGQMKDVIDDSGDDLFASNALLLRGVLRTMNSLDRQHSLSQKKGQATSSPYELCMSFNCHVHEWLYSRKTQPLERTGDGMEFSEATAAEILLKSEILSFFGRHIDAMPTSNLMSNEQKETVKQSVQTAFESIVAARGSTHSIESTHASSYFLASMAVAPGFLFQCVEPTKVLQAVLDALDRASEHGLESPLLDAAMCSLIRNADLEQTRYITASVLRGRDGKMHQLAFVVKIFHSLLVCANRKEQHEHISGQCKTFLRLSMGLLRGRRSERAHIRSDVELFAKTTTTLISKKELMLLSGREIAMICCEMNPLFQQGRDRKADAGGEEAAIFKSCCSVVASLIAHYPKQLYGCPSPLFSLLLALLSDILQTSDKKCLTLNCLEYAKVCELLIPHKDIIKKHIVGLLLAYIRALNEGMSPLAKSKLMPSVYALLDMCSEFETRQINAMIDVSSKALFAPVFQSYRKYYQYHGQA